MLLTHEFISPAELTGFAREALADLDANQFRLRSFLPDLETDDIFYSIELGSTTSFRTKMSSRSFSASLRITWRVRRPASTS